MIRRVLAWLNAKLGLIETDPEMNAYYDWADQRLDAIERKRKLATNPLLYTDVERAILDDVRARSKAGLPIPIGYIVRADGTIEPHND